MNTDSHFALVLELFVKSAALTVTGLALLAAMRRSSAANRHAVVAATFAALLLLPFTKLAPPLWSLAPEAEEPRPPVVVRVPLPDTMRKTVEKHAASPAGIAASVSNTPVLSPHARLVIPWKTLVVAVWFAGAALLLARRALISLRLRFAVRQSRALENPRLAALARQLAEPAGASAEIRASDLCRVPLAAGVLRPVVLLPVEAAGWSDELICSALRHELGHIRRRDCVTRLVADVVCALHWLNPLVWLAARRLRLAQEQACDDVVLISGARAEDYAGQLVDVVRSMQDDSFASRHALAMAQPSTIETRVVAIMDATRNRSPRAARGAVTGAAFAVAMLAICTAAQVGDANEEKAADAVKRGLAFLAARQNPDGSLGRANLQGSIGVTSLAGLAMMADDAHAGALEHAMKYVLQSQQPDGYFHTKGTMYDHGFATIFLAEALRAGKAVPGAKESVTKAVAVIQKSQNPEGGWRYQPQPDAEPGGDSSMTSCQLLALVAARDAGIDVRDEVINKAAGYLKRCQDPDGGFHYILRGGNSAFPRSAAALAASAAVLKFADAQNLPDMTKATDYVLKFLPKPGDSQADGKFFIHGNYYAAQAMHGVPGDAAKRWRDGIREHLLGIQQADGSWADKMSVELTTSQACLTLHPVHAAPAKGSNPKPKRNAQTADAYAPNAPQVEIGAKFIEFSGKVEDLPELLQQAVVLKKPGVAGTATANAGNDALKALDGIAGVDVLQAPRVTTFSKRRATVEIIREFKYPTEWDKDAKAGGWKPKTFDTKNVGVTFDVTPEVNADGSIALHMIPEVVEFDGFRDLDTAKEKLVGQPDPSKPFSERLAPATDGRHIPEGHRAQAVFNTRKIDTTVTVKAGDTVVLGGVEREDVQKVEEKNPKTGGALVAEVPITKRLIVLVTARIAKPAGIPVEKPAKAGNTPGLPAGKPGAATAPARLEIEGDSITIDKKTGTVSASGKVEIKTADAVIRADTPEFTPKKPDAPAAAAPAPAEPKGAAMKKAKAIILPKIDLRDATLSEAVDFLRVKSKELDPEKKGVNLVLIPSAKGEAPKITLNLVNVPLIEVIKYVTNLTNYGILIEDGAITIRPLGE